MALALHLDVVIDDQNAEQDLRQIIPQLRPEWRDEDVKFKVSPRDIKAGMLNLMIMCFSSPDMKNGITFRIRRNEKLTVTDYLNRVNEAENITLMRNKHGFDFVPNVLATFNNGFCYDYIDGHVMTPETISLDGNWRTIAKQLAMVHSMTLQEEQKRQVYKLSDFIDKLEYPETLKDPEENKKFQKYLPSKDYVMGEIKEISDHMSAFNCNEVFCHNDARPENMVWNDQTGKITLVDWECAAINKQPYEIAYHFRNYAGFETSDFTKYPNQEFQMQWIRVYLETYYGVVNRNHVVSEEDVRKLYIQVNFMYLMFLIQSVSCISVIEEYRSLPFDVIEYCRKSYDEYRRVKEEILALNLQS